MKAWQSVLILILVITNVALILVAVHGRHRALAAGGGKLGAQVIDMSDHSYPGMHEQVIYDFDRKTVSLVEITWNTGQIPSNAEVRVLHVGNYLRRSSHK